MHTKNAPRSYFSDLNSNSISYRFAEVNEFVVKRSEH